MNNNSICTGPSGGVVCHGAATSRVFTIYENFSGKSRSVLLLFN
ncbi:lipoprotein [Escherichia coli]|nr:lipoprotein [Escherichia coli]